MAQSRRFVVTGASGWFGRTALWEYEQLHGPDALRRDVISCASTAKPIDIGSAYGPVAAVGLEALDSLDGASGLINLAFIHRNPGMPIITTSSGAAAVFDQLKDDFAANPYAALKQEEEELWRRSGSEDRMAAVFRVYAASGRFIKDPKVFALSDFLCRALCGERIEIRSTRSVIRSYVHVGTMMRLFWAMLDHPCSPGFRQVDAVMQSLSLVELAQAITVIWGLPDPLSRVDASLPADDYRADSGMFRQLLQDYAITAPDLAEQLHETAQYLS